jgi:hypothetical protein
VLKSEASRNSAGTLPSVSKLSPSAPISLRSWETASQAKAPSWRVPVSQVRNGKKDFDAMLMELLNHLAKRRDAAWHVAQKVELVSVIHTKIWVHVPDQHGIDGANAAFGVAKKAFNSVFTFFRIVKRAIPDEHLHLGEDMLRPLKLGSLVLRAVVTQAGEALRAPGLQSAQPILSFFRRNRSEEKGILRLRNGRKVHYSGWRNESMAGLPLVSGRQAGQDEHRACCANGHETRHPFAGPKEIFQNIDPNRVGVTQPSLECTSSHEQDNLNLDDFPLFSVSVDTFCASSLNSLVPAPFRRCMGIQNYGKTPPYRSCRKR